MDWLRQIGGLLEQYAGADARQAPPQAQDHFAQLAQSAPPDALAQGMAHAFRSDQTPPFGQMVGQLFGQSDPDQRAGLLNTLLGAAGPLLASQAMGRGGGLSGLAGLLGGGQVSPHQAAQVSPQMVQQLAGMAEQHDPSIIDTISGYYAQNPALFHGLGAGALTAVLSGLAGARGQGPGAGSGGVLPASQDPWGDPADQPGFGNVMPASQDPYGDPADQEVLDASQDPYGDPADGPPGRRPG